jgi:5-methyltetrahydropteroyltriglutamate--homocysteine methyltransferase
MTIQTTHVGSLPRPAEMVRRQIKKEEMTPDDLEGYVEAIVGRQITLGLSYVNDGEITRADYINATTERVSGFNGTGIAPLPKDLEELPEYSRRFSGRNGLITLNPKAPVKLPACSEELSYVGEASLRGELERLTGAFKRRRSEHPDRDAELFFTAPSPGTVALFFENNFYPDYQSYLARLGEVLSREYEIIQSYGVFLQVDCPDLAMGRHTAYKNLSDEAFIEIMEMNIAALNGALSNVDAGRCRAHICWGNYPGTHHRDIELRKIFASVMGVAPRFVSLESCNHRHAHEWELFKEFPFPEDKVLMPGVIDTTSNTVEHPDLVSKRVLNFAGILGPERVIACTDCGFASTASAASVTGEVAWLKLEALVRGAEIAGKKL